LVIALMVGWKWIIRIPLILFWIIAISLSFTPYGFLTYLYTNHVTTSIALTFATLYFLALPIFRPLFPKLKTNGGEIMERSTKILVILLVIMAAIVIVAMVAPGAVVDFTQGTIIAPIIGGFIGFVTFLDTFRASHLLAGGIIGGLVLALAIKKFDLPKRIRYATRKPAITPNYQGPPAYVPPTTVSSTPAPIPAVATAKAVTEEQTDV